MSLVADSEGFDGEASTSLGGDEIPGMKRWRFDGGLGKPFRIEPLKPYRNWKRQRHFRQVNLRCASCGAVAELETDHIVPLQKGGKDEWTNLQSLCKACHARKTASEATDRAK